ncbi:hypothetical protein EYF88_01685 [Paracoccus sediminis]|uniref:Uncharacterized protein n=1 Tax=Paracoccus sediminis TaxID=1214787 RepID=A0A238USD5_9RHOB|nr:hypothetical protein [Paracoccus sediminis]TBN52940.1 hypothetical protein EYF88_01685 [Paracoccus sediminis]SNR24239.1 hypothetical protein SAMN06265378_101286 [Paracoccus sediminis]
MSHNDNNAERSASRHRPALIAIAVALLVALIAFLVFMPGTDEQNEGIATTPPPADTPITDAEGLEEGQPTAVAPEGQPAPGDAVEGQAAPANN